MSQKKILGLFGKQQPEPICGGVTDQTDFGAPKTITSKEITGLYTSFRAADPTADRNIRTCRFTVSTAEGGAVTACDEMSGKSVPADKTLLHKLQTIIDEQKLAEKNGVCRITAGLAPEYQPCELNVTYASGETLRFTVNNDPFAPWALNFLCAFSEFFSEKKP